MRTCVAFNGCHADLCRLFPQWGSRFDLSLVAESRDLVHRIGVTNMNVEWRIAGAHLQQGFLMGGVEVVAKYELHNINRGKLEALVHRKVWLNPVDGCDSDLPV